MSPGSIVSVKGQSYRIRHILDLQHLLAERIEDGYCETVAVAQVQAPALRNGATQLPLELIEDDDWREAFRRLEVIRPFAEGQRDAISVRRRASEMGCSSATIYRYLDRYTGHASSLLPLPNTGGRKKNRLPAEIEALIGLTIQDYYLTPQRRSATATVAEAQRRCKAARLPIPSRNTVLSRISVLPHDVAARARGERRLLRQQLTPRPGSYKEAEYPLSVVQMDFTPIDIIVVDPVDRKPAGRPWLSLAIDVNTRVVVGLQLALDEPGADTAGLCLTQSILPKDGYLRDLGVTAAWPVWGIPRMLHVDNGRQFRSQTLRRACAEYGITLNFRPVARPQYGAHIERLIGTTMKTIHELPGSTFSNPGERRDYDSVKTATLTLKELEQWLVTWVTTVYHQSLHSALGMAPLAAYERGLITNDRRAGPELPERIFDEEKLKLDFLPYFERPIVRRAIVIDYIHYWDPVLTPFLAPRGRLGRRPQYLFRRDPVDISRIWFWHPELKKYQSIPYVNVTWPPMSVWELRAIKKRLSESRVPIDDAAIMLAWEELRRLEQRAKQETRERRRARQRRQTVVPDRAVETEIAATQPADEPIDSIAEIEVNYRRPLVAEPRSSSHA